MHLYQDPFSLSIMTSDLNNKLLCELAIFFPFPDHIPVDLRDPFYTDQYEQEHIKPPIIRMLLSGELYCRVCGLILHAEQAASLQNHQSVIQALSRKGIYVLQPDNTPVSELDLRSAPVKMVGARTFCPLSPAY